MAHRSRFQSDERATGNRFSLTVFASVALLVGCSESSVDPTLADATTTDAWLYPLPPERDSAFGPDSFETRDRATFPCGTLSGAVTAKLVCDRLYPDLNWDFEPDTST